MVKERKKSNRIYFAWDYENEENYINENSKNGWQLIKGGSFNSLYEKDNSQQYVYKIDYNGVTINKNLESRRYIEMFEEMGWEYINSTFNGWNYFRKPYNESLDKEEYEIYTDPASYNEMLERWYKLAETSFFLDCIVAILYIILSIYHKSIIIGIGAIIFFILAILIKKGLNNMKNKFKGDIIDGKIK